MARTGLMVALGRQDYAVERPWGELPLDIRLSWVTDVAVDSHDCVYLLQRSDPPIIVFNSSGKYLRSFGSGQIADPHAIFCIGERVLAVDRDAHQILEFDGRGALQRTIGQRHRPAFQAPFNAPTDVAVARSGEMYVSDGYGNATVHCFSRDGTLRYSWGQPGSGPGEFVTPHAVRVHPDGRVFVADRENDRLQVFTSDGKYLDQWCDLYRPMDIYIDPAGLVYVSDQVPRLSMFSPEGVLLGRCRPSTFNSHGVFGDSLGNLYLAETPPEDRLTRLTKLS